MNEDHEALKRLLNEEDARVWLSCPACGREFPNWSAYLSHYRRDHGEESR
jgi:uncharacterized C2H2 Zn-finger protein